MTDSLDSTSWPAHRAIVRRGWEYVDEDNLLSIVNAFDAEIDFARGLEAALRGLECTDKGMHLGVREIADVHVMHLEAIRERIDALRNKANSGRGV